MMRPSKILWLPALSLLCCLQGIAATVYKSIDANGVVTYSDTRPPEDMLLETMEFEEQAAPPNEQAQEHLQDMRDTTDRMISDRMAREKHRAELRQLDAQSDAQQSSQDRSNDYDDDYVNYDDYTIYPGYYGYPVHRPWHPDHHPRPGHPIARPPMRPPHQDQPPDFRPSDFGPGSLIRRKYDPKVREAFR